VNGHADKTMRWMGSDAVLNFAAISLQQVRGLEQQVYKETLATAGAEEAICTSGT